MTPETLRQVRHDIAMSAAKKLFKHAEDCNSYEEMVCDCGLRQTLEFCEERIYAAIVEALDAQPSDAGEREAFMAEIAELRDELEGMPGQQYVSGALYALDNLRDRLLWKASQQPPAPREQEHKA